MTRLDLIDVKAQRIRNSGAMPVHLAVKESHPLAQRTLDIFPED
jgi:hypothetical protein